MKIVRTVTGDVDAQTLGHCQCHEHLFLAKGKSFAVNPALWMDDELASLNEALLYKQAGGSAFVDAQPVGAGSMPRELWRVAEKTGVKIIASTGFHKLMFYPQSHWIFEASAAQCAEFFTADCEKGMAVDADNAYPMTRCSAKAGMIKCALDEHGLHGDYEKLFLSAAAAHKATGAPMMIHTEDGAHALELIDFLKEQGVAVDQIIICHAERSVTNFSEKLKIAQTGVYLQCDTIARFKYHSDEDETLFLKRLCEEGFEDRILIGLDTTRQRLTNYVGQTGLDYILTRFLPMLREYGFTSHQIDKMCRYNPAAALEFKILLFKEDF